MAEVLLKCRNPLVCGPLLDFAYPRFLSYVIVQNITLFYHQNVSNPPSLPSPTMRSYLLSGLLVDVPRLLVAIRLLEFEVPIQSRPFELPLAPG